MSYPAQVWLFMMIVSRLKKVTSPAKILSFFSLTVLPHQNIGNRSDKQINDTNKSLTQHTPSSLLLV